MQHLGINETNCPVNGRWMRWIILMSVLAVGPGCPAHQAAALPPLERTASAEPQAEADFRAALEAREHNELDEAHQRFKAFLEVWPHDPLVPFARLELGTIDLARGKYPEARKWFEGVTGTEDRALAERGHLYAAVAAQRMGEHQTALGVLRPLVGRTIDPRESRLVLDTIALAEEALGDDLKALESRDRELTVQQSEPERREVEARVQVLVDGLDPTLELPRAYEVLPRDGFAWPLVGRRLLTESHQRGERERVQAVAADLDRQGVPLDEGLRALVLRAERSSDADPGVIGAILPLSGRGREVGEAALHGLMLASSSTGKGPRLIYRDDMGDPARAKEALEDLVSLHRVIAVIGPVATASAQAVAARARELSLPMISLSPDPTVSEAPGSVFRLLSEPREEALSLVRHALAQSARRFVVMVPEGPFGAAMQSAFEVAISARGGALVQTVSYPATATSFVKEAESVAKLAFDALVIADAPNRVALIAPALASHGLWSSPEGRGNSERSVLFLVPSFGYDPSLARTSRRYLQRAVFSVPFDAARAGAFVDAYRSAYQSDPNLFAASAHDAYRMLEAGLATGARTREALAKALASVRLPSPVGASDGFGENRGPRRAARLETLTGEAFVELAGQY
jgi:ABC-type branched-subunit amino acid transport system substrate-binding protein